MGLLYDKRKLGWLHEVDANGKPLNPEASNQIPEDYTDTPPEAEEQPAPDETQETGQDENQNQPVEEEPPEDYTDTYGGEDQEDNQEPNQQSDQGNENEESEVDDIKHKEEELYRDLTPEQLDIKHKELKTQYLNLYDKVVAIIDRIGDINIAEENIGILEYVSNTLANLKDMISDYMNSIYKTKSYFENSINYNRFLAVLGGINKILEEMNSKNAQN